LGIRIIWDNEDKTILRYLYEGRWDQDDFSKAYAEAKTMLDSVNRKVGIIIDIQNSHLIPNGIISRSRHVVTNPSRNEGLIVIVGANAFIRSLADTFSKLWRRGALGSRKMVFAATLEDARQILSREQAKSISATDT
jgi:hypothetical protein